MLGYIGRNSPGKPNLPTQHILIPRSAIRRQGCINRQASKASRILYTYVQRRLNLVGSLMSGVQIGGVGISEDLLSDARVPTKEEATIIRYVEQLVCVTGNGISQFDPPSTVSYFCEFGSW